MIQIMPLCYACLKETSTGICKSDLIKIGCVFARNMILPVLIIAAYIYIVYLKDKKKGDNHDT